MMRVSCRAFQCPAIIRKCRAWVAEPTLDRTIDRLGNCGPPRLRKCIAPCGVLSRSTVP